MILACLCGRRYRISSPADGRGRTCPQCGGVLQPEAETLVPAVDINVLIEQMQVLRDELVARDRQLRQAQAESTVLRAELDQLRSRVQAEPPVSRPVRVERTAAIPHQLPSNRVPLFTSRDP